MTLEAHPGKKTLAPPPPPNWGELAPEGRTSQVVRFALADRTVTFPFSEFRRWERMTGERETLTILTPKEAIVIEGHDLAPVSAALDLGRLCELRLNFTAPNRPGPRIARIAIEPA